MSIPTKARHLSLLSTRSLIFQTTHNPLNLHTGTQYLQRKLKGELQRDYYPELRVPWKRINAEIRRKAVGLGIEGRLLEWWKLPDLREERRLSKLEYDKKRGKGAPKKGEGRRSQMKKRK